MNAHSRNKRNLIQKSPKSKRPKLNFTSSVQNKESKQTIRESDSFNGEWDEDFSGVVFEKACLLADLSQVIKDDIQVTSPTTSQVNKSEERVHDLHLPSTSKNEIEKLKLENEKLKESLKTKEGEVHILRSQLKQTNDIKQADNVNHIKIIEDVRSKHAEKLFVVEKQLESIKTTLDFKDLEITNLTDRCKQLENNRSKLKLIEPHSLHVSNRKSIILSQVESVVNTTEVVATYNKQLTHKLKLTNKTLNQLICPEIFQQSNETHLFHCFATNSNHSFNVSTLDFNKKKKYIWNDLPCQTVHLHHLYPDISHLLAAGSVDSSVFHQVIPRILTKARDMLLYQQELLQFLKQHANNNADDPDQLLLDYEEQVACVCLKQILSRERLNPEECSLDTRRVLGLIVALMTNSEHVQSFVLQDVKFLNCLAYVVKLVGELKRPIHYSGLLISVIFLFKIILRRKHLDDTILSLTCDVTKEIIFARPKLNVLRELIIMLQQSIRHNRITEELSKKSAPDSCSLFIDSRFKNVIFFQRNVCPLYLLFTQIMGLACIPTSVNIRCELTHQIIKYFNMLRFHYDNWLLVVLSSGVNKIEKSDLLTYMLHLCVCDYKFGFRQIDYSNKIVKVNGELIHGASLSDAIGCGVFLLKRIILNDPNIFDNTKFGLLFTMNLNRLKLNKRLTNEQKECINWIIEGFEKQNNENSQKRPKAKISYLEKQLLDSLKLKTSDVVYNS